MDLNEAVDRYSEKVYRGGLGNEYATIRALT
jgi:hypothetical protein